MLMDGIHVPLTIPFARDGAVAWAKLEANVGRYSLSPVSGLVALAPGCEAAALTDEECAEIFVAVRRKAGQDKVLVAGIARESVRSAVSLIEAADSAEFDAVLAVAPRLTDAERAVFLRSVADGSPLPMMLWDDGLPLELVSEMARHANVIGAYVPGMSVERMLALQTATAGVQREVAVTGVFAPATRRLQAAARADEGLLSAASLGGGATAVVAPARPAVKLRLKTVGFQRMSAGEAGGMLQILETGAAGAMPMLAACCPQAAFEVYAAFKDGDLPLALEKSLRLLEADRELRSAGVAGVKHGCDVNGYAGGPPRLPRLALTSEERRRLDDVLRGVPS
jgi:4-hydroxy-2-oxoglutarate aldolase